MLAIEQKNPDTYRKIYIDGKGIPVNRGIALGKEIADALEEDKETGNAMKDFIIAMLPKYDIMDKDIFIDYKIGKDIIPLKIKPDSLKSDMTAFYEYKTGAEKSWNQKKVDNDPQIKFYATGIYILTKKIPATKLIWAPTKKVCGEDGIERPELTGEIVEFTTHVHMADILKMMGRMRKAWRDIETLMDNELL